MSPMNPGLHPKSWPPYQDRVYDVKQPSNKAFSMTDKPEKPKSRRITFTSAQEDLIREVIEVLKDDTQVFLKVFEGSRFKYAVAYEMLVELEARFKDET